MKRFDAFEVFLCVGAPPSPRMTIRRKDRCVAGSFFAPTQMSAGYPQGAQTSDPRYLLVSITHKHGATTLTIEPNPVTYNAAAFPALRKNTKKLPTSG